MCTPAEGAIVFANNRCYVPVLVSVSFALFVACLYIGQTLASHIGTMQISMGPLHKMPRQ